MPAAPAAGATGPSVDDLIRLLSGHRQALLGRGPMAADEIEAGSQRLEQAFATLAATVGASNGHPAGTPSDAGASLPGPSRAALARLQDELQATQATLSKVAAGNRRALDALFGEASLYSR